MMELSDGDLGVIDLERAVLYTVYTAGIVIFFVGYLCH